MQNLALPMMLVPTQSCSTRLARELRKNQLRPLDELRTMQFGKLKRLLELAEQESKFYGQRFRELDVSASGLRSLDDIRRFPITTKDDIESNFPDGMVVDSRRNTDWQYVGTRGTTRRVMVVHDFERRDIGRAAVMLALTDDSPYCFGASQVSIPPDACSVHCGIEGNRADSVSKQLAGLATGRIKRDREGISDLRGLVMDTWVCRNTVLPPLDQISEDDSLRACVDQLRDLRPIQLMALPEYLRALADYIHRTGDRPPPIDVIRPMGANFPRSWKDAVEDAFRGKLREHYGSREMDSMAFDCAHTNGLHVMMDRHLIEVVRSGMPVQDGEIGQILVTDLQNLSMPLIRYQIGDLARIDHTPCPCGRTTPRLTMEGRLEDAIVTADHNVLTAEAIANFFSTEPGVYDFELNEGPKGRITIRVVPKSGESVDTDELEQQFRRWSGVNEKISTRVSDAIRPEASGKYRHSKSRSFDRFDDKAPRNS